MTDQNQKAQRFAALHETGIFIVPNPWDIGSALLLEAMGFQALASTSSGVALTLGRRDGKVSRDEILRHCASLTAVLKIPLTADLENGFGDSPDEVAQTIRLAAQAGLSGGSIEDYTGDPNAPLYPKNLAVERVAAAVEAAAAQEFPFVVTARAEQLLRGEKNLDAAIERLIAFEKVGAQVLYAPGLSTLEQIETMLASVTRPVNVLIAGVRQGRLDSLERLGVRRVSTGGALARACIAPLLSAGQEMLEHGSFDWLQEAVKPARIDRLLPPDQNTA